KLGERMAQRLGVARLDSVVELFAECLLHLVHDADQIQALSGGGVRLEELRRLTKEVHVLRELRPDSRTLNLDHRAAAIAQHRGVHLTEARRSERMLIDGIEELR